MNRINFFIKQASECVDVARGKESVGEYRVCLNLYKKAVTHLLEAHKICENEEIKGMIKQKMDLYLDKAEQCKAKLGARGQTSSRQDPIRPNSSGSIVYPQQSPLSPQSPLSGSSQFQPLSGFTQQTSRYQDGSVFQPAPPEGFIPMPNEISGRYPVIPTEISPVSPAFQSTSQPQPPTGNDSGYQNNNKNGAPGQAPRDPRQFRFQEFKSTVTIPDPVGHIDTDGLNVSPSLISKGTEGSVFRGTYYGSPCAVKVYFSRSCPISREDAIKNIAMTMSFAHPNVIQYFGYCDVVCPGETEEALSLIMELCDGDLESYVLKQTSSYDKNVLPFFLDLAKGTASAMSFLHSKGYVHSDIKPQNVLFKRTKDSMIAKLCDFGMTARLSKREDSDEPMATLVGLTPNYSAPEVLKRVITSNSKIMTSSSADVFAFGLLLHFMIAREHPYLASSKKNNVGIIEMASSGNVDFETPLAKWGKHPVVDIFGKVIRKCLGPDSIGRPTMSEVYAELDSVKLK